MIEWNATKDEHVVIGKIADRFIGFFKDHHVPKMELLMDLEATHCNGNPLKLQELLESKDADFAHDVSGIQRYIDRSTGKLQDCFSPRYSQ